MKKIAQPTRSFFTLKISSKTSPGWLQLVFHFGTENRADQLKKPPCINVQCTIFEKSNQFSLFKSSTALHYKYLFMMWKLCCLIMHKILIQVPLSNMSNIKYCLKSECYSSWTRMTVAQCPNMDRTVKLIGNNWNLRVEYGYTWYASDLYMIMLFEWSLYEKSIQVIF